MTLNGKCPEFNTNREINLTDKSITVSVTDGNFFTGLGFKVMAKERCDTEGLIRYIGKTYIRYKRILEVEKISDAEEYLHLCYHYSFKIKVGNTNEVISVANEVDKSIVSLRIRGACSNSIYNAARKLTGNIGVHFSREDAINVLQEANELITLRVAADAIDTALSIHFSRVKATKSVSVKKVVVESVEKALDLIKRVNNGVCILKAPTGSGKTNKVLQLLYEEHSEYCTYIVHRRSIARSVMLDMSHYQDDVLPFKESSIRALRIVVNSLIKENLKKITNKASLLLVDEAQQTLNHVVSCRLDDESDRELIYNEFLELVKKTKKVVMCDADINDSLIEFVTDSGRDVFVYQVETNHSEIQICVNDLDAVKQAFYDAVRTGKRALLATDNAKQAEGMYLNLINKFKDKKVLLLTKQTIQNTVQKKFLENPNNLDEVDVLIYSPVITSSVSIVVPWFDAHFGLFEGILVPTDCIQMLRRSRTAKLFYVGLNNPKIRNYSAENKHRYMQQYEGKAGFDRIAALIDGDTFYLKSHFVSSFIKSLELDKFRVVVGGQNNIRSQNGRLNSAVEKQLSDQEYIDKIVAALEQVELVKLRSRDSWRQFDDFYQNEAREIRKLFNKENISVDEIIMYKRGALVTGLENLKLALSVGNNISELCAIDNSKSQRDRFYPRLRAEIFSIIFATLNIDINSGTGTYTETEAKKLLKILHMKSNDFNQLSDQIQVAKSWVNPSHAVRSVNRILRHFFMFDIQSREYKVNGVRNSKYMICTAKLAVMQKLVRNI